MVIIIFEPSQALDHFRPRLFGFGLMYCRLSIEPGPTGLDLGPFQLYSPIFLIGEVE